MRYPRTVLVLRFSSIGDIVQTTSVVGTIKAHFPQASLDFMTLSKYASLLEGHPHINKIHAVDIDASYMSLKRIGLEMETMGYDLVIDLHNSTRSRTIRKAMVKTPMMAIKKPRWKRFKLFVLRINDFSRDFNVRTWLHEPLTGILPREFITSPSRLFISDLEKSHALEFIASRGIDGDYFVITPGAAWAQKQWLGDRYAAVIDQCVSQFGLSPVLIGGQGDAICELIKNTADSMVVDAHGETNLRQSMAIVSQSQFVIGSDTGFIHIGEALGVPVITILGPTSKETGAGTFNKKSQVIENKNLWCRPCSQNGSFPCYRKKQYCMTSIQVEEVNHAISRLTQS